MTIQINPNRLRTGGGVSSGVKDRRDFSAIAAAVPSRAHVNLIPSPESLATLIRSAVSALKRGVFWDRGSILNLLV